MCSKICASADIPERLKGKVYVGGVLAVLPYGCESWCLTVEPAQAEGRPGNSLRGLPARPAALY